MLVLRARPRGKRPPQPYSGLKTILLVRTTATLRARAGGVKGRDDLRVVSKSFPIRVQADPPASFRRPQLTPNTFLVKSKAQEAHNLLYL